VLDDQENNELKLMLLPFLQFHKYTHTIQQTVITKGQATSFQT